MSKSSRTTTELVRDRLVHPAVGILGERVYWSTETTATIERAPLAGGATSPFVTTKGPHTQFLVADGRLVWTVSAGDAETHLLAATEATAADPLDLANLGAVDENLLAFDPQGILYDSPVVYAFNNGVQSLHLGSSSVPEKLSGGCFYPTDLVIDDGNVYWSCQDGTFRWVARGRTSSREEHVEKDVGWGRIATRGDGKVYVTDANGGLVRKLDVAGRRWEILDHLERPGPIAVDDSGVYVGTRNAIHRLRP